MVGSTTHGQTIRFTGKTFENHRGNITATIGTVVDNQTFLIQLRIKITGELIQTFYTHIRDIDISYTTIGCFVYFLDIVLYPVIMI